MLGGSQLVSPVFFLCVHRIIIHYLSIKNQIGTELGQIAKNYLKSNHKLEDYLLEIEK